MIKSELGRFGDKRLACVGGALLAAMQRKRTFCLHRLAKDRNQTIQFGRFLTNPAVTAREMLATTARLTNRRAAGRHVLAIMDTTELDFPTHAASKRGFGNCGNGEHPGLFLHPVLAVDADKAGVIGLLDCAVVNRTEGKVSDHKKRGADDKESRRWLHGAEMAADGLADAARITVVGDRESDIYDLFARRPANVHLLCRSAQARAITSGGLLPAYCATLPEQARDTIDVPAKGKQAARQATVALRFGAVSLKHPAGQRQVAGPNTSERPKTIDLRVVDVQEVNPPKGVEPVHWRLLTTHTLTTLEQARQIVGWYRLRWVIEQVFRSLKSHCLRIGDSQVEEAACFIKLAVVALIAAVRAMQLVLARDGRTAQPIHDAVDPADMPALGKLNASLEGRTAKLKNPHDDSQLAWYAWIIARLGGWSGYTSRGYRPPGPKTMHHGLLRIDQIMLGWRLANRSADVRLR
jgi:DDE family transposase